MINFAKLQSKQTRTTDVCRIGFILAGIICAAWLYVKEQRLLKQYQGLQLASLQRAAPDLPIPMPVSPLRDIAYEKLIRILQVHPRLMWQTLEYDSRAFFTLKGRALAMYDIQQFINECAHGQQPLVWEIQSIASHAQQLQFTLCLTSNGYAHV